MKNRFKKTLWGLFGLLPVSLLFVSSSQNENHTPLYKPYIKRMNMWDSYLKNSSSDSIDDININFMKVGVIEIEKSKDDFDLKFLNEVSFTNNAHNIHIINYKNNDATGELTKHGKQVVSTIGTPLGINNKSKIYYSNWKNNPENLEKILEYFAEQKVDIINCSFGIDRPFLYDWFYMEAVEHINKIMLTPELQNIFSGDYQFYKIDKDLKDMAVFADFIGLLTFEPENVISDPNANEELFAYVQYMNSEKNSFRIFNKYIRKYGMKIFKSAGNKRSTEKILLMYI
ncbi:S8/S53 family peptidase [Mycoplasma nasistruthionis]|uniref:S8 family peptidase n=1 Tax=Mycoplasma nasistruthionis TaxID=353852 RepID=A0A5B7XVQ1_9MOLU|nr:S8/S53 family peptidase [Mycoplasma nasistruthionis]QCZ36859.1 S8 family peptidase [Mycoplasma nasistruthionis]